VEIELREIFPRADWAPLVVQQHERLGRVLDAANRVKKAPASRLSEPIVILDGLLGIGAGGALREPIRSATREINALRASGNARVFALDLPTGLDADSGAADPDAVVANYTLFAEAAAHFVGRLAVLPLDELTKRATEGRKDLVAEPENLRQALPRRNFDTHKGTYGRVGIVAGSRGFVGAAIMASESCTRAGAGLITLFVTEDIYPIIAAAISPEVMVHPVKSYLEVLETRLDALAIGPGLGLSHAAEIRQIVEEAPQPMVVDADALNSLAGNTQALSWCAGPRLLTPHPGEMARLDPEAGSRSRRETVEAFTSRWPHVLLLKGARTIIGQEKRPLSYNTTGSPGMGTGGMGDVLTGVCAALAGQGLSLYDAARVGAWVCGRAAELALSSGRESEESLIPPALMAQLGPAFEALRGSGY
jgi:NAD(P)H-hydrate epimerase